ncbi:MAG: AAA family ATPase [Candidatus Micrarchaeia archaeon]|jgi:cell division control protein 6
MPSFGEFASPSRIFRDRDVLSPHFIPNTLHFREHQIRELMSILAPALQGKKPRNLMLYGKTGTGKTCCTKHVSRKFEEENPNAKIIYINCRMYNKPYRILSKAIKSLTDGVDKQGYGLPFYYEKMLEWCGTGRQLILILDEIDMAKNIDELIYTLTRANDELEKGGVSLIGISNRLTFKEGLDPRSKSSLYEREMVFPPYTAPQLQKILQQRVDLAFKENVISAGAINLASAFTAQDSGDARYALKLLLRAAELAEERSLSRISDAEVKEARDVVETDLVKEAVDKLPEHHQLVLYAVGRLTLSGSKYARFEDGKDGYLFSGDVYEDYSELCSKLRKAAKTARSYRSYLTDLEMLGLVTTVESGKGIRGHTKLIKLGHTPQETVSMMRQKFGE